MLAKGKLLHVYNVNPNFRAPLLSQNCVHYLRDIMAADTAKTGSTPLTVGPLRCKSS